MIGSERGACCCVYCNSSYDDDLASLRKSQSGTARKRRNTVVHKKGMQLALTAVERSLVSYLSPSRVVVAPHAV